MVTDHIRNRIGPVPIIWASNGANLSVRIFRRCMVTAQDIWEIQNDKPVIEMFTVYYKCRLEVVWKYFSPHFGKTNNEIYSALILAMYRYLTNDAVRPFSNEDNLLLYTIKWCCHQIKENPISDDPSTRRPEMVMLVTLWLWPRVALSQRFTVSDLFNIDDTTQHVITPVNTKYPAIFREHMASIAPLVDIMSRPHNIRCLHRFMADVEEYRKTRGHYPFVLINELKPAYEYVSYVFHGTNYIVKFMDTNLRAFHWEVHTVMDSLARVEPITNTEFTQLVDEFYC